MTVNILVIAYKFNDIFYSLNTEEFPSARKKSLIILSDVLEKDDFPFLNGFDDVYYYKVPKDRCSQLILGLKIGLKNKSLLHERCVFLTNPYILLNQLILLIGGVQQAVMIEDGVMNYYKKSTSISSSIVKKIQNLFFCGLGGFAKFKATYLTHPDLSLIYLGVKKKLNYNLEMELPKAKNIAKKFNQKRVLIGGGEVEFFDLKRKRNLINKVCKELNIELYVPHHTDSAGADGVEIVNVGAEGVSLEMIYPYCKDLRVYSFGSTATFNALRINRRIISTYLQLVGSLSADNDFDRLMKNHHAEVVCVNE